MHFTTGEVGPDSPFHIASLLFIHVLPEGRLCLQIMEELDVLGPQTGSMVLYVLFSESTTSLANIPENFSRTVIMSAASANFTNSITSLFLSKLGLKACH